MQGSRFEWRISALALFAFLAALSCGNGTTMSGRMGELGRGLFVSACQVSQSPFSWSYENDSYEAPCPAFMLDLNLAVGSEVGVSYSDVEGNLDGRVDPGSVDLESAAQDLLQVDVGTLTPQRPGLCALLATTADGTQAVDLIHVQSDYLDALDVEDATFVYSDAGTAATEEGDALVIYGTGELLEVMAVMRSSDGRPLGGRRAVDWSITGPLTLQLDEPVTHIFGADITIAIPIVAEGTGEGWVTVRDQLTGLEGKRRIQVR